MTFEVGAALEDAKWQAPAYCFDKQNTNAAGSAIADIGVLRGSVAQSM